MVRVVLASLLVTAQAGGSLKVTYEDCGAKHAKVTDLKPTSIKIGTSELVTGTGIVDEDVTSATFKATVTALGKKLTSCSGDGKSDVVCKLPLGVGAITIKAVSYPLKKGTVKIPVEIKTSSLIPPSLAKVDVHIAATEQSGESVICLDVHTAKEQDEWEEYKQKYAKVYNGDDDDMRRGVFETNLEAYAEQNAAEPLAQYAPNEFSDFSSEEFEAEFLSGYLSSNSTLPELDVDTSLEHGSSVDWTGKYTTGVKNQGGCGSCWAFSAIEQVESDAMREHGWRGSLSTQELVDCTSQGQGSQRRGCQGGDPTPAYKVLQAIGGVAADNTYRYTGKNGVCKINKYKKVVKVSSFHSVGKRNENTMKSYLSSTGPLSVCVDAHSWQGYHGGIKTSCGTSTDHCVQIVGYGSQGSTNYWKVRNSWGSNSWGEGGFMRLAMGKNLCNIANEPTATSTQVVGSDVVI